MTPDHRKITISHKKNIEYMITNLILDEYQFWLS